MGKILVYVILFSIAFTGQKSWSACNTIGEQNIAVIIADYPGALSPLPNMTYLQELFSGTLGSVSISDFFIKASENRAFVKNLKFLGPYHSRVAVTYDPQGSISAQSVMQKWQLELMTAAEREIDLNLFDRIVFITPSPLDLRSGLEYAMGTGTGSNYCDLNFAGAAIKKSFGHAWIKSQNHYTGINYNDLSTHWDKLSPQEKDWRIGGRKLQDMEPIMHELGHTLGLGHANRLPRPSKNNFPHVYDEVLPDSSTSLYEINYGDLFSFMSNAAMGWPSIPHRAQLGWINKKAVTQVRKNETFRIYLNSTPGDLLKGLEIPRWKKKNEKIGAELWVEYRNLNSIYEQNSILPNMNTAGALVYYTNPNQAVPDGWDYPSQTLILNFEEPGTTEPALPLDFTLKGEWKDPHSLVDLNVLNITPSYLDVRVTFRK